ncbi:polyprenyl synthetase family protein [Mycobacterium sp. ITM-2016-00317]|uniref:polyprenyl synthetase family protein n=1 Tax=Mycobacterium sp. ITM-2016-00317 TaxID=2099694 RepID=UPI00287F5F40|nr:polyprenyl synthetase family protein [Mycobacterium sp. ITM-2016-00317]WNG89777.1 polyprenyl synthetase family protein [Mycobacterium sp. ITM-2016-00317]
MPDTDQTTFLSALEDHLHAVVRDGVAEPLRSVDEQLDEVAWLCRSAVQAGGKRLRPRFAYWAWRVGAPAGADPGPLVRPAAALELLHAAILVHDDVIDRSEVRRGQPSVRAALAAGHRSAAGWGDPTDFGDHMALLVGDLLWSAAHDTFDDAVAELPLDLARGASRVFRAMRAEVLAGQLLELRAQAGRDYRAGTAEKILRYKTSAYTVERPMTLGLQVAGSAGSTTAAVLRDYAGAVGQAFQLRDDLADLFGTTETSGKRTGDDIRAGKPTELLGVALNLASEPQVDVLTAIVGSQAADEADIADVQQIMLACGAAEHVRRHIADLVATADRALTQLSADVDAGALDGLKEMLVECTELSFVPAP